MLDRLQSKRVSEVVVLPSGKFSKMALAVAGLLAASLLTVVEGTSSSANALLLSDLLQAAVALWAAYCCFHVARHSSGYLRQLWMLLATALSVAAVAQALETYYQNLVHLSAVTPWPSDILFIFWVTPAVMMLLPRPAADSSKMDWQQVLDFAQVAVVGLSAYLYFFYAPSRWQIEGPQMLLKIVRLQWFRDSALAAGFLIRAATVTAHPIKALFRRMSGIFLLSGIFEAIYLFGSHPSTGQVDWNAIAWCVPFWFATVFAATWKSNEEPIPREASSPLRVVAISHVLPVGLPLLVLLMSRRIAVEQMTIAWAVVTGSFILSSARLLLANQRQRRIAQDLRQAEDALRQSAEMFSAAFRSSPDAISLSFLPNARYTEVNESFSRMTGYTREESVGKSATDLNLWVDLDQRMKILARLQAGEEVREEDFLLRTKSGEIRTAQLSAASMNLRGQRGILGMVRDVTDRKRAEEALRASEKRFRNLIQDLHVGIILIGSDTEAQFINRAALRMFGRREEQILGKSLASSDFVPIREDGTEIPLAMCPGPRAIETQQTIHSEVVGWRLSGSNEVVWTQMDAVPQFNDQGQVTSVLLSYTNITERKEAEEALRASEAQFRTLVDNVHMAVVLLGPDGTILFANQATQQILDMPIESLLGKKTSEIDLVAVYEDGTEMPFAMRPGSRLLATGKAVRNEVMGWRRPNSNEVLWILGEIVPLFGENGQLNKLIASFSDITKQKQAEEALRQLSTRLLQLQDEERRRLARELHDSLAQSVLAVNLELAEVARSSLPLDEQAKRALSRARAGLQGISQEIRTMSYLLHPPMLDELGLASAVQEYAIGFSERSGIKVEVDLQGDFEKLGQEAATALFRVAQESLTNVQRHSGSPTARIRLRLDLAGVQLQVSDQGHGIDQATLERGHATGARLGVGLLGMRERMLQLGGKLDIESTSSGTRIRATIPIKCEVSDAPSYPRSG